MKTELVTILIALLVINSILFSGIATAFQDAEVDSSSVDCYFTESGYLIEEYTYTLSREETITETLVSRNAVTGDVLGKHNETSVVRSREGRVNLSSFAQPVVVDIELRDSSTGEVITRLEASDECMKTGGNGEFNLTEVERKFIKHLNQERQRIGVQNVSQRSILTQMGRKHSRHMDKYGYFAHEEPDSIQDPNHGDAIRDRYQKRGLLPECRLPTGEENRYYPGVENIATTVVSVDVRADWAPNGTYLITDESDLARALFNIWNHSEPHRKAMTVASADQAGLGVHINSSTNEVYASLELC